MPGEQASASEDRTTRPLTVSALQHRRSNDPPRQLRTTKTAKKNAKPIQQVCRSTLGPPICLFSHEVGVTSCNIPRTLHNAIILPGRGINSFGHRMNVQCRRKAIPLRNSTDANFVQHQDSKQTASRMPDTPRTAGSTPLDTVRRCAERSWIRNSATQTTRFE
jgi:hypothetical protein